MKVSAAPGVPALAGKPPTMSTWCPGGTPARPLAISSQAIAGPCSCLRGTKLPATHPQLASPQPASGPGSSPSGDRYRWTRNVWCPADFRRWPCGNRTGIHESRRHKSQAENELLKFLEPIQDLLGAIVGRRTCGRGDCVIQCKRITLPRWEGQKLSTGILALVRKTGNAPASVLGGEAIGAM